MVEIYIHPQERVGLFIDGANLYFATKSLGFDIDYRKLLKIFQRPGRLVRAYYYTALFDDHEYSPIRPLVDWLDYNGYTMITKPAKEYTDFDGNRKIKGNMDIELAIDMLEMADHIDHAVLFSGDGDFRSLVQAVQKRGLKVTVISTLKTQPPMIADELRRQADQYIDLVDIAEQISRGYGDHSHPAVVFPNPNPQNGQSTPPNSNAPVQTRVTHSSPKIIPTVVHNPLERESVSHDIAQSSTNEDPS